MLDILRSGGSRGVEAASDLERFLAGTAERWQIALGAPVTQDDAEVRTYIGSLDPLRSQDLLASLRGADLWGPPLRNAALEVVERLRPFSVLMGLGRRYAGIRAWQLYFSAHARLSARLLAHVCAPIGSESTQLLLQATAGGIEPLRHGWSVAVDDRGELLSLKLEIAQPTGIESLDAETARASEWIAQCGSKAEPVTFSLRHRGNAVSRTIYWRLVPPGPVGHPSSERNTRSLVERARTASDRAIAFILARQDRNGFWSDFDIPMKGASDEWVTAHVALKLAMLPSSGTNAINDAIDAAVEALDRRWRPGWGYSGQSPIDADSTAHGLLLLHVRGRTVPRESLDTLLLLQQSDGGFATFALPERSAERNDWSRSQLDVTVVAARALLPHRGDPQVNGAVARACQWIASVAPSRGPWPAYWWRLRWYTLAAWLETDRTQVCNPFGEDSHTLSWTCDLDAALLVDVLRRIQNADAATAIVRHLIDTQTSDGRWPGSVALRVPWPFQTEDGAPTPEFVHADVRGIYSAATILSALRGWASAGTERQQ